MFFKRKEKIDDPLFGSMTLVDDETQYSGTSYFTPLKEEIEIDVFSDSGGPTERQRSLYREIEQRYLDCIEKLPQVIEEAFRKEGRSLSTRDFSKEFQLTGITIPRLDETNTSWVGAYVTAHVTDGWIEIQFTNWEPKEVSFNQ